MQAFDYSSFSITPNFEQWKTADLFACDVEGLSKQLLAQIAHDLDPVWGSGQMSVAAYDTAWVAMVRCPGELHDQALAFPRSFEWLLDSQAHDGSWSGPTPYSLLPTLAGLLALLKAPPPYQCQPRVQAATRQARAYLKAALADWSVNSHESVGFEVLAPALLTELEECGVFFEFEAEPQLMELYRQKLLIAGPSLIYTGQSNLIHSTEAFRDGLDFARLKSQQMPNGGYGCSPAATAAVLVYGPVWDEAAADWLACLSEGFNGAMPNAYPIDAFEIGWVLYNLAEAGIFNPALSFSARPAEFGVAKSGLVLGRLLDWLYGCLGAQGASISRLGGLPTDSDDTGMVLAALHLTDPHSADGNTLPSLDGLLRFEREEYYACFELERGASLSANAHVLAALLTLPTAHREQMSQDTLSKVDRSITKVTKWLLAQRNPAGYWEDKWHLSPYYATASVALALSHHPNLQVRSDLEDTLRWLLETHSERDGGWSSGGVFSTLEETAYAVQTLKAVLRTSAEAFPTTLIYRCQRAIESGQVYLGQRLGELEAFLARKKTQTASAGEYRVLPELWRGKELYSPERVVVSAVLSALTGF